MTRERGGFPSDFWWGTGASSTQCEGAAPAGTWFRFEQEGKAPPSGDGNGFSTRYAEDFANLVALGLTHHRLSIEWARLEPEQGRYDEAEIERYRRLLADGRDLGMQLWVCLHHFSLPTWFADGGGFLDDAWRLRHWRRHCSFMAETFGDLVVGWKPINEPLAYAGAGWLLGMFPPAHTDMAEFAQALRSTHLAAYEAAAILRQTGTPVCSIHNLTPSFPADASDATRELVALVDQVTFDCWISAERDGVLRVPMTDPVEDAAFPEAFDLVGFSNYNAQQVRAPFSLNEPHPPDGEVGPLGYVPSSAGIGPVLDRLHAELPDKPILVCEHGVGTHDDARRCAILTESLGIVADRIARGYPIAGFFHWTGVDNYEWLEGYDLPFGLYDRARVPKPSAELMASYARPT